MHVSFSSPFQSDFIPELNGDGNYRQSKQYQHKISKAYRSGQSTLGRLLVREEPQHTNTCCQPCRSDCTRQVAGQGGAATHEHMWPTLLARQHLVGRRSGRSRNTRTHATNPASQTALGRLLVREEPQHTNTCSQPCRPGRSCNTQTHATNPACQTGLCRLPVREEPQHTNTCSQPCRPDRTRQVAGQGGATTHEHMRPTLPAKPHSASCWSGRSRNTRTHAANPAGQTALGRSPVREEPQHTNTCGQPCRQTALGKLLVREEPQHTNTCGQPCRPNRTRQVAGQGGAATHEHMRPTLLAREEPQHTNTCNQPCLPDRTRQVAGQGGATTHEQMRPTLPARPHSAGHLSGRSRNTRTHATNNPASQIALGRSPVREEPQRIHVTNPAD